MLWLCAHCHPPQPSASLATAKSAARILWRVKAAHRLTLAYWWACCALVPHQCLHLPGTYLRAFSGNKVGLSQSTCKAPQKSRTSDLYHMTSPFFMGTFSKGPCYHCLLSSYHTFIPPLPHPKWINCVYICPKPNYNNGHILSPFSVVWEVPYRMQERSN